MATRGKLWLVGGVLLVVVGMAVSAVTAESATVASSLPSSATGPSETTTTTPPTTSAPSPSQPSQPSQPSTPSRSVVVVPVSVTADKAPATATDGSGPSTNYEPENMIDGRDETAWRIHGDGSGRNLVFTFATPVRLSSVGLIPGYTKVDPTTGVDHFPENRRVLVALWTSAEGVAVRQHFTDSAELQTIPVDMTTTSITLRIVSTRPPGDAEHDFTLISEASFAGHSA